MQQRHGEGGRLFVRRRPWRALPAPPRAAGGPRRGRRAPRRPGYVAACERSAPRPAGPPRARRARCRASGSLGLDGAGVPRLLAHLEAERAWYEAATSHLGSLSSTLRSEMEARVPDRQRSSTWARPRFSYYTLDARNRDYTVLVRESRNNSAHHTTDSAVGGSSDDGSSDDAVVVLDVNALDAGTGYLDLGLSIVSPDETTLAYAVDTTGDEVYTLRFRDLRTGADLPDRVERVYYSGAWTADSSAFLYTVPDAAYRPDRGAPAPPGHPRRRRRGRADRAGPPLRALGPAEPQRAGDPAGEREPRHRRGVVPRPDRLRPGAPLARRPAARGDLPRRARPARARRGGPRLPAPGHRRRCRGVPPGRVPGARSRRPDPRDLARGAPGGPGRAPGAGRRVRRRTSWPRCVAAARTCSGCSPPTTWPGRVSRWRAGSTPARSGWPATRSTTPTRSPSPTSPAPSRRSTPPCRSSTAR